MPSLIRALTMYSRSASPPPPMPSPQLVPTPLPSPTPPRRSRSPSRPRSQIRHEPLPITPNLIGRTHLDRGLALSKSCDHLYENANPNHWADSDDFGSSSNEGTDCGSDSDRNASPFSTQRSLHFHTPTQNLRRSSTTKPANRLLSVGMPYHSPPPSPTLAHRPPPVPPIPAFALSSTDKKPTLHSPLPRRAYIHFPSLSISSSIISSEKRKPAPAPRRRKPMTCLRFFSLCNSSQPVVAHKEAVAAI